MGALLWSQYLAHNNCIKTHWFSASEKEKIRQTRSAGKVMIIIYLYIAIYQPTKSFKTTIVNYEYCVSVLNIRRQHISRQRHEVVGNRHYITIILTFMSLLLFSYILANPTLKSSNCLDCITYCPDFAPYIFFLILMTFLGK